MVSFATKLSVFFSTFTPSYAFDVPNSIPVKTIPNKATNQIPSSVSDVVLLNCFTLLDKILKPRTNRIKNGIPTKMNRNVASNHFGNVES